MNEITSYVPKGMQEIQEFCQIVAKSTIVPKEYIGKPENVFVACIKGMDLGLKPLQALECIAVINGKTSLYGDSYLAIARGSGKVESYAETVTGEDESMKAIVTVKRKGEEPIIGEYSAKDAKTAGLWGKAGPWALHPKRMLIMKARNYVLRAAFADLFLGLEYSVEELQELPGTTPAPKVVSSPAVPEIKIVDNSTAPVEALKEYEPFLATPPVRYKIDDSLLTGVEVNDIIQAKIDSMQSKEDYIAFDGWKRENEKGLRVFMQDNKDIWLLFRSEVEEKRVSLMNVEPSSEQDAA